MASRAAWQGPRGFSLESITTAPGAGTRRRAAAASMGSDMKRRAAAVEAAAERCRKERREKCGIRTPREPFQARVPTNGCSFCLALESKSKDFHHRDSDAC